MFFFQFFEYIAINEIIEYNINQNFIIQKYIEINLFSVVVVILKMDNLGIFKNI